MKLKKSLLIIKKMKQPKNYNDLKVLPLNIDTSKLNEISKYPLCDIPHLLLLVGRVKSGKSVIINNLYLNDNMYGKDFQVRILVSPSAYNDAINTHLINEFDYIFTEYSDDLIDELIEMIEKDKTDDKYLIIFDDIVGSNVGSKRGKADKITSLSTLYRHLGNGDKEGKLSMCIATQYFKHLTPILRNQASGVYICGSWTDKELKKVAETYDFFGNGEKNFINLYKQARVDKHDFLFLNCHSMEARRNHNNILWSYDDDFKDKKDNPDEKELKDKTVNNSIKENKEVKDKNARLSK